MSLSDLFGPHRNRPEHPDMRLLVDLALQHDGKSEDQDYDMDAHLATIVDPASASHMATQRAVRLAHLFGRATDVPFLLRITGFWLDGFILGYLFRQHRENEAAKNLLIDFIGEQIRYTYSRAESREAYVADLRRIVEQAKKRAALLDIEWKDAYLPVGTLDELQDDSED